MSMNNANTDKIAVKISGVKKMYKLGQIGGGTLQADLQSWWARVRGKEDPNSIIGENQRSNGNTFMALNGIDLTVYQGEALGVIGSNGAGKSTLLKILSRVTAPTEGEIDIYGRIASMLEVGTGFNQEMTGRENVYLNGAILGMTKEEIDSKMEDIIEFSEVREFIDTPVKRYSSGMFVKLAFSVAAHLDAEIMIMDEVLAVGDMAFQTKCLSKMRDAANQGGRTVLYVSHNMNTIRQLCDRCVVLDKGKVVYLGEVEDAIRMYMKVNEDTRTFYDYTDLQRNTYFKRTVLMQNLNLINKTTNQYDINEIIEFDVRCKAEQDEQDIYMRMEISFADTTMVGTVFSDKAFSIEKDQTKDVTVSFITKSLPPGKYKAVLLLFQRDDYGNQKVVDRVEPGLAFEIVQSESNDLLWLHQWWGHVHFDDMKIESVV